ncbi:MAG TPA: DUF5010 domain-containing protein [Polyangiaceae bacterium]|nr:DUF5010 domain-containing protein [Polyangiaceae bacterium]
MPRDPSARAATFAAFLIVLSGCGSSEPPNGSPADDAGGGVDASARTDALADRSLTDVSLTDRAAEDISAPDAPGRDVFTERESDTRRDVPPVAPEAGGEAGGDAPPVVTEAGRDGPPAVTDVSPDVPPAVSDAGRADAGVVLPEDIVLVPPVPRGTVLGTVTGYEVSTGCPMPRPEYCEAPIYSSYDRNTSEWWDILVDEHLLSRVNVVMAHGRGCFDPTTGLDGNGNMCPRHLSKLVAAIDRAGAGDVYRLGMWDDTGAYPGARNYVDKLPDGTLFDLADHNSWRFFWDHNMTIWFDTIPSRLWYRLDGRPVVAFWSLAGAFFSHQQGNASLLLRDLRAKFQARYGENPLFILDQTWTQLDSTITVDDGQGMDAWFVPPGNNFTYRTWGGSSWGALVPGFRDPQTTPGCGSGCREVPRRDGQALRDAFAAGLTAKFSLLEGWTDIFESAGYYRSSTWRLPNLYIDVVRESADPTPETLRFQAEAADLLSTQSASADAATRVYRKDATNIGKLADGTGWYVDFSQGAGWLEYSEVTLGCGTYRLTARVAAATQATLHLEIDGTSLGAVTVPPSGGLASYELVHLGAVKLAAGKHNLRLVSDTAGVNVDWFFVRRAALCN